MISVGDTRKGGAGSDDQLTVVPLCREEDEWIRQLQSPPCLLPPLLLPLPPPHSGNDQLLMIEAVT